MQGHSPPVQVKEPTAVIKFLFKWLLVVGSFCKKSPSGVYNDQKMILSVSEDRQKMRVLLD